MAKLTTDVLRRLSTVSAPVQPVVRADSNGAGTKLTAAQRELQESMMGIAAADEHDSALESDLERDTKEELNAYLRADPMPLFDSDAKYNDPLRWWKKHELRFPRVHALAMEILQVEATSASSERVFSSAGLTIAKDRASLLPENAGMLVFLRGGWCAAEHFRKLEGQGGGGALFSDE